MVSNDRKVLEMAENDRKLLYIKLLELVIFWFFLCHFFLNIGKKRTFFFRPFT